MQNIAPLQPGHTYHLFNRGNNREDLFREERNYRYFLELYARHVHAAVDTYAYCLMRNHFHLLVRVKTEEEWESAMKPSQGSEPCEGSTQRAFNPSRLFSNLFNAYAQAINKAYGRTGSLFEERFRRIEVTSHIHFTNLIFYIHFNPQKHGFVEDFRTWPWSFLQRTEFISSYEAQS
ncbi:MAG: transposase [Candidatus Brachytrichaceae bacterium NZ_4S206]|jgi:REP element-mobilizing transposase RayT